jgi:hypothetical protein
MDRRPGESVREIKMGPRCPFDCASDTSNNKFGATRSGEGAGQAICTAKGLHPETALIGGARLRSGLLGTLPFLVLRQGESIAMSLLGMDVFVSFIDVLLTTVPYIRACYYF